MPDAFYDRLGEDRYRATDATRGPWNPEAQHAGPASALLGGALEAALGTQLVRVSIEILRPLPIGDVTVSADVLQQGRSTGLAQGVLADEEGPLALARAWSIRRAPVDLPDDAPRPETPALPAADELSPDLFMPVDYDGYHTAMDVRFTGGGAFDQLGPAAAWMRTTVPIVAGEQVTPTQRVLVAADSGNGISASLPLGQWLFVNTDLTVHLWRPPVGEWVHLAARTHLADDGVGVASTSLSDHSGAIGIGAQSLLIAPVRRPGSP